MTHPIWLDWVATCDRCATDNSVDILLVTLSPNFHQTWMSEWRLKKTKYIVCFNRNHPQAINEKPNLEIAFRFLLTSDNSRFRLWIIILYSEREKCVGWYFCTQYNFYCQTKLFCLCLLYIHIYFIYPYTYKVLCKRMKKYKL